MKDSTLIEKFEIGNFQIETHYDLSPAHPRTDFDNKTKIITVNRKYGHLGDIIHKENEFKSFEDFIKKTARKYKPFVMLPLYVLDHSGLHLSLTRLCQWDSSLIGVILINKKELKNGWKLKKVTLEHIELAKSIINQDLDTYNDYLVGNVYGYKVFSNGKPFDSSWSFYGYDEMKNEINNNLKNK